jgi:ribosomal protein S18 acetylase RimI-like enzyme
LDLYIESFPSNERHSIPKIKDRIISGNEILFGLKNCNELIGMALIWNLNFRKFVVLDYFAIKHEYRDSGIGSSFLNLLSAIFKQEDVSCIIEVENPYNTVDIIRYRRAIFYKNNMFKEILDFKYTMPPIDNNESVEMILMILPNEYLCTIKGELVVNLVSQIYQQLYYLP